MVLLVPVVPLMMLEMFQHRQDLTLKQPLGLFREIWAGDLVARLLWSRAAAETHLKGEINTGTYTGERASLSVGFVFCCLVPNRHFNDKINRLVSGGRVLGAGRSGCKKVVCGLVSE